MFIKIPFQLNKGSIDREEDLRKSVDQFIELLVSSYSGCFVPDSDFGFIFKNFKFENFDELGGTIFYGKKNKKESVDINYTKKINNSSNNPNSFALDLKRTIDKYEQRLKNVTVKMDYHKKTKLITLEINAKFNIDKPTDYHHTISFHIW